MIIDVAEARYVSEYSIWLKFNTGETGVVDLRDVIFRFSAAEPLRNQEEFRRFFLDSWPTLAWEGGFDLAPETLYERATGKTHVWDNKQ
jgi:hypothetical protein